MVLSEKGKYERMNKEKQKSVSCNGIFGFSLEKVKRSERVYKPTMFSFFFFFCYQILSFWFQNYHYIP